MRHRKLGARLGRTSTHRRAMFRNLVTSLLDHERVETTGAKAREVRRLAERMITLGKRGTLDARRRALRVVRSKQVTAKLFDDLADRYRERAGGYTRVLKTRTRPGDAARLAIVELVEEGAATPGEAPSGKKKTGRAASASPASKPRTRKEPEASAKRGRRTKAVGEAGEKKKKAAGGSRRGAKAKPASKEEPAARSRRGGSGSGRKKSS